MQITIKDSNFILQTGDKELMRKFRFSIHHKEYKKSQHKYVDIKQTIKMYEPVGKNQYRFSIGYIFYVLNACMHKMTPEKVKEIVSKFKSELSSLNYYSLYPNQIEDLDKLLKYKFGIFQCYTGYGKSEVISVLAKNLTDQGLRVLIIVPSKPAIKEVRDRIKKYYTDPIHTFMSSSAMLNIVSPKSLVGTNQWEQMRKNDFKALRNVDVVLADEVEMTLNNSFYRMKSRLTNAKYFYGFSASANKSSTDPIPRDSDLLKIIDLQINSMVANYGFTAVYQLPTKNQLTITSMQTNLSGYRFMRASHSYSKYAKLVTNLYAYPKFQKCIKFILEKVPCLYIPINNLDAIDRLLKANLTSKPILTIQGSGYHIYQNGKRIKSVTLPRAKELVLNSEVHAVLGTISSFRALDFHNLGNILCTFGKATSVILQYVGRISREIEMNLWYVESNPKIPIYSSTIDHNKRMIEDFYQNCDIQYREEYMD